MTTKRPFYVIGHNPNTLEQCRSFLEAGANGLEPDVQWDAERNDLVIAHDPEDAVDAPLARDYLRGLLNLSQEFPALALIVLDNKTQEPRRGAQLLGYVRDILQVTAAPLDAKGLSVLLTVPTVGGNSLFWDIEGGLGPREAIMFDQDSNYSVAIDWMRRHGVARCGYGHGIGGIDTDASPVLAAIEQAVAARALGGVPRWTYIFSPADRGVMRDAMRTGVDGMIVDLHHVGEALDLVNDPEFSGGLRLGTLYDDPFDSQLTQLPAYTVTIGTMRRNNSGTDATVTIILEGSSGSLQTVVNGAYDHRFETGDSNCATLFGDVGTPTAVWLQSDGSGEKTGWLPDDVHVRRHGDANIYRTSFGEWIYGGPAVRRVVGTTRYRFVVKTADVDDAGTDADILFTLHGSNSTVFKRVNAEPRPDDALERNGLDHFYVTGADVGAMLTLELTNDGTADKAGWMVEYVDVFKDNDNPVRFGSKQWVDGGKSIQLSVVP